VLDIFFEKEHVLSHEEGNRIRKSIPQLFCAARRRRFEIRVARKWWSKKAAASRRAHVKELEEAQIKRLPVHPNTCRARSWRTTSSTPRPARSWRSHEILTVPTGGQAHRERAFTEIRTLYVNDLDRGPYISDTLRIDPTKTRLEALVEI